MDLGKQIDYGGGLAEFVALDTKHDLLDGVTVPLLLPLLHSIVPTLLVFFSLLQSYHGQFGLHSLGCLLVLQKGDVKGMAFLLDDALVLAWHDMSCRRHRFHKLLHQLGTLLSTAPVNLGHLLGEGLDVRLPRLDHAVQCGFDVMNLLLCRGPEVFQVLEGLQKLLDIAVEFLNAALHGTGGLLHSNLASLGNLLHLSVVVCAGVVVSLLPRSQEGLPLPLPQLPLLRLFVGRFHDARGIPAHMAQHFLLLHIVWMREARSLSCLLHIGRRLNLLLDEGRLSLGTRLPLHCQSLRKAVRHPEILHELRGRSLMRLQARPLVLLSHHPS
mmetsp:Transcript_52829/g.114183  ORF Transcript_52829/g.114183 Transcript_52829/m.114183 type:complete len:328 (-) Transcript_52829:25-1008(-)